MWMPSAGTGRRACRPLMLLGHRVVCERVSALVVSRVPGIVALRLVHGILLMHLNRREKVLALIWRLHV